MTSVKNHEPLFFHNTAYPGFSVSHLPKSRHAAWDDDTAAHSMLFPDAPDLYFPHQTLNTHDSLFLQEPVLHPCQPNMHTVRLLKETAVSYPFPALS